MATSVEEDDEELSLEDLERIFQMRTSCSIEMAQHLVFPPHYSQWRNHWRTIAESQNELGIQRNRARARLDLRQMRQRLGAAGWRFHQPANTDEHVGWDDFIPADVYRDYGATHVFIVDRCFFCKSLDILLLKMAKFISTLCELARKWKATPTFVYTHLLPRPDQMNTVGKQAAFWVEYLVNELEILEITRNLTLMLGAIVARSFERVYPVAGSYQSEPYYNLVDALPVRLNHYYKVEHLPRKFDKIIAKSACRIGRTVQRIIEDIGRLVSWQEAEVCFKIPNVEAAHMAFQTNDRHLGNIPILSSRLKEKKEKVESISRQEEQQGRRHDSTARREEMCEIIALADGVMDHLDRVTAALVINEETIDRHIKERRKAIWMDAITKRLTEMGKPVEENLPPISAVFSAAIDDVAQHREEPDVAIDRIRTSEITAPFWDGIFAMLTPEVYVSNSIKFVDEYCGLDGVAEKRIEHYKSAIKDLVNSESD
ncbi:hypothetical protein NPX13_g1772 [Xylaria arbuscula]|uniref:Uncharacterized protein n=1 Tax=Xylaria arbuscula TaxID=114810 RepID=A0A9W8NM04_9PEZI|nr:hypothetical protein NPX13_g1772 [Xylaria arbuscula]